MALTVTPPVSDRFAPEHLEFISKANRLGAQYLDYGNGLTSISVRHSLGQEVLDLVKGYLKKTYEAGQSLFRKAVEVGSLVIDWTKELGEFLWEQRLDFLGMSEKPAKIDRSGSVAQFDMPLEWFCDPVQIRNCLQAGPLTDGVTTLNSLIFLKSLNAPPYIRWRNVIDRNAPALASVIKDKSTQFLFVPGVNTEGLSQEQRAFLDNALHVEGKRIIFAHSAGASALLNALKYLNKEDLKDVVLIFASPRVSYEEFDTTLMAKGLSLDQVIVIGSSEDFSYPPSVELSDLLKGLQEIKYDFKGGPFRDHAMDPNRRFQHVFLEEDITAKANPGVIKKILDHGSSFNGILDKHRYNLRLGGSLRKDVSIEEVVREIIQQNDQSNGN